MTIKNKKTKEVSSSGTSESKASTSVQKSVSKSSTVQQQSSSSSQKVTSSGKKVRYIEVKVEEDDPLMITDVTDHGTHSSSTISEFYNSHPHYIITEAPSIPDLSQIKSSEHNVSDMSLSKTGEFVSSSNLQQSSSSSSHQQSSTSEKFQTSSSSAHQSQSFDKTMDSTNSNRSLNTAFIDSANTTGGSTTFLNRSNVANASDILLQSERQDLLNKSMQESSHNISSTSSKLENKDTKSQNTGKFTQQVRTLEPNSIKNKNLKTNSSNFYGGEGTLDKNKNTKELSSTTQSSESKSSSVTKSSSSSYVVEIVDGKERVIDSSNREWGDAKEHASKEAYASISGTDIKPETVYSSANYDMKSKFDSGKDGNPKSELHVTEDSKLIKDGKEVSSHSNTISDKNVSNKQLTSSKDEYTSKNQQHLSDVQTSHKDKTSSTHSVNTTSKDTKTKSKSSNQSDSSNFYAYDATINNELKKVNELLNIDESKTLDFSSKIMKSNTTSAEQASTSSYVFEIVDGKEIMVDSSHREWGDSQERSSYDKSHTIGGTGVKPEHEYSRHTLNKESHYDTGKGGIPSSSLHVSEDSVLMKDGKEIASTSNVYGSDVTKKKAIKDYDTNYKSVTNSNVSNISKDSKHTTASESKTSSATDSQITKTTDFIQTEKDNLLKESSSTIDSQKTTKDTLTSYEKSTGTWNGKFTYEKDNTPKNLKQPLFGSPQQPRHHLQRQDTEDNIILSSRDIKDFTSISDLRKIIESSQTKKNVRVSDKSIVINRNIDDKVLKEIIETVKKYPFKRIEKVSFGTKINEDVKDLYEGVDSEHHTIINTTGADISRKSYEVEKTRSQIEVIKYITKNGITRREVTYEDAKEDEKVKTNVFMDKSALHDIKNLVSLTKTFRYFTH